MIRKVLLVFSVLIFTPVFSIIVFFIGFFDRKKNISGYFCRLWSKTILYFSNIKCNVVGLDNIDNKKQYIFISNHQSALDILLTFASIPLPISFFAKKELFLIPLFGWAMITSGMISVNRNNKDKSKKSVDKAIDKIYSTNLSFLNYPEGTRTDYMQLNNFKKGGFILAIKSKFPVVPLTLIYNENFYVDSKITLVVDNAIDTLNYRLEDRDTLISKVRNIMISNLNK